VGKKARKKAEQHDSQPDLSAPWISMHSGLIVMGIVSIGLSIWTSFQITSDLSILQKILWGLIFGISVWLVFFGFLLLNRFLRRK
jgi:peptidoglycan biosynthesis protein MviN/MurJ (putative lipid II flippase)